VNTRDLTLNPRKMTAGLRHTGQAVYFSGFPQAEAVLVDSALRVTLTQGLRSRFLAASGIDVTVLTQV
jgi:hypothetical protein